MRIVRRSRNTVATRCALARKAAVSFDDLSYDFLRDPLPPPDPRCRCCITVPAKNEADYLLDSLTAFCRQEDLQGRPLDLALFEIILLANNCSDGTADLARTVGRRYPQLRLHVVELTLPPANAYVGFVRKLMMDEAARRLPAGGIIAMTDADTVVDPRWLAATFRAFDRGARAVGGRILVPPSGRHGYRKIHLQDVTYRSLQTLLETMVDPNPGDPWPRHFQHYGPSLAVSREAYLACGGMPSLRCIEDAAFAWALQCVDVDIVHDPAVRVYTSDRSSDRINGVTFSNSLEEWTTMQQDDREPVVFGLQHCIELFKWKVALRRAFYERRIGTLPALNSLLRHLNMDPRELQNMVVSAPTFGELFVAIRQRIDRTHGFSDRTFSQAIGELRRFTHSARESRAYDMHPVGTDRNAVGESDQN